MNLFETKDVQDEQTSSQSQLMGESMICNEALGHKERGRDSQINVSSDF